MELLRERLIECGWRDETKALCRCGKFLSNQLFLLLGILCFLSIREIVSSCCNICVRCTEILNYFITLFYPRKSNPRFLLLHGIVTTDTMVLLLQLFSL
ncbi:hypothetical protein KSP39_PZI012457 [Platanthera zijinensis]|uniref:Uncharacterized protein n=1 Tax=Platanthera zijinensis TaxID=2320716 RepID=A0AAP0G526_9ASPA